MALRMRRDFRSSFHGDDKSYGRKRAIEAVQKAYALPQLKDSIELLKKYYDIFHNLSRIEAYKVASQLLIKAQADMIIRKAAGLPRQQAIMMVEQWENHYKELSYKIPDYEYAFTRLAIVKNNWLLFVR